MKLLRPLFVVLCIICSICWCSTAFAGQISLGFENMPQSVGLGVGFLPDYEGSDDYMVGVAPFGRFTRPGHEQYFMLTVSELQVNLIDHPWLRMGPSLNYRFGRSDVDDSYVDKMHDIDGTLEAGGWFGVEFVAPDDLRKRFVANIDVLADTLNEHDGYTVYGNLRGWYPVASIVDLGLGFTATYASNNFMDTYYGVDSEDAGRSGLKQYNPGSGFKDLRFNAAVLVHLSKDWHVAVGMQYKRLVDDAEDSPIVDDRGDANQFLGGVGVGYSW